MRRRLATVMGVLVVLFGLPTAADAAVWVEPTPAASWGVNGRVNATVITGDTVIVGGSFSAAVSSDGTSVTRKNIAAFSLSTGALLPWNPNAGAAVRALVTDGTSVWAGGNFQRVNNKPAPNIAKISLADGRIDEAFSARAFTDKVVWSLALRGDELYAGGDFTTASGAPHLRLAKFDSTGAIDPTFTATANGVVLGLAAHPAARVVYASGKFDRLGQSGKAQLRTGVGALDSTTGAVTPTIFASSVKPTLGLTMNEDGSRLFGAGGAGTNAAAAWDTTNGVRVWRSGTDGDIQAIAYYDGIVYFGFHDGFRTDLTLKLLAVNAVTGQRQNFYPRFDGFWGVFAIAVNRAGVVIGGEFTTVGGTPASNMARFPSTGVAIKEPVATTLAGARSVWKYWDADTRPTGWQTKGFGDATWSTGLPQLGYGDGDEAKIIARSGVAAYFRYAFTLDSIPSALELELVADDGAIVYLNGVRMVTDNMPDGTIAHGTLASSLRDGGPENALRPFSLNVEKLNVGTNVLAVEVHQVNTTSEDLSFDAELTAIH